MALLPFDELNTPKVEVESPEQYFAKMDIPEEQKEERIEAANDFYDVLLFLFALLTIETELTEDYGFAYEEFYARFGNVVRKYGRMDEYMQDYIDQRTKEIFDTTKEQLPLGGWWTSSDRAMAIGENDANSVLNYEELQKALEAGYRFKEWRGVLDSRERKDHVKMEKRKIPIDEYFVFPDCMMMMPHDEINGTAKQVSNCRCSLAYSNE